MTPTAKVPGQPINWVLLQVGYVWKTNINQLEKNPFMKNLLGKQPNLSYWSLFYMAGAPQSVPAHRVYEKQFQGT